MRDVAYARYDIVFLLGPLSPQACAGLPAAAGVLAERTGSGSRRAAAGRQQAAARSVRVLEGSVSDDLLIRAALDTGYRGLPWSITVAEDRVAVLISHGYADGIESMPLLEALLIAAVGGEPPTAPSAAAWPMLRAIRSGGLGPFRGYFDERRARNRAIPALMAAEPTADQAAHSMVRLRRFVLDSDDLRSVRRGWSGGGRATVSTRLTSLAIAAFAACARSPEEVRVTVPMNARHLVSGAARIAGTFIANEPIGGLHGSDWSPAALNALLAERRRTALPAVSVPVLQHLVSAPTRMLRRPASSRREHTVSVSTLPVPAIPASVWAGGEPAPLGCATIGPWPSAAFAFLTIDAEWAAVSVSDESGRYDIDGYEAAFRAEIGRRLP